MSRQTRRDFLKTGSAVAAAGLAVPYFFTSASAAEPPAGDDKLVVAAIGVGNRGTDIGSEAARLGRMVAVADVHLGNAHQFVKLIETLAPKVDIYQDYRKVLERNDVQAVTIGTPDHWHVKIAIEAMKAGKDVYCEKPLTLTIDEGRLITQAVKDTKRVFQAGTQQRSEYYAGFLEAVAIARSGRLGKDLRATAFVGPSRTGGPYRTSAPPKDLDWDLWLGQAPKVDFCDQRIQGDFRWWIDYSGGDLTDWGVHNVDIALWALGGEQTGILEVEPVEGKCKFPLGREVMSEYLLARARGDQPKELPNEFNVATTFELDMRVPNGHQIKLVTAHSADVYIEGEHGRLAVNRGGIHGKFVQRLKADPQEKAWLDAAVATLYRGKPVRRTPREGNRRTYGPHMLNFFECVKDRSLPISDVYTQVNTMNALHMSNIAMLLGRKVRWDADMNGFYGDDEADDLIARPQREPYTIKV